MPKEYVIKQSDIPHLDQALRAVGDRLPGYKNSSVTTHTVNDARVGYIIWPRQMGLYKFKLHFPVLTDGGVSPLLLTFLAHLIQLICRNKLVNIWSVYA